MESKLTTRNVSRLYGVPYKFADIADIFCYFLFIERTKSIIYSFRDVSLSRNGPVRDAGHFFPFRDCPGLWSLCPTYVAARAKLKPFSLLCARNRLSLPSLINKSLFSASSISLLPLTHRPPNPPLNFTYLPISLIQCVICPEKGGGR